LTGLEIVLGRVVLESERLKVRHGGVIWIRRWDQKSQEVAHLPHFLEGKLGAMMEYSDKELKKRWEI